MINNPLNYWWLINRRAEQVAKIGLTQDPDDPKKYFKKVTGGYKTTNGLGEVIEETVEKTTFYYHWDGGNIVYDAMSKATYVTTPQ